MLVGARDRPDLGTSTGVLVKKPQNWLTETPEFCFLVVDEDVDFTDQPKLADMIREALERKNVFGIRKQIEKQDKVLIDRWVRILRGKIPDSTPLWRGYRHRRIVPLQEDRPSIETTLIVGMDSANYHPVLDIFLPVFSSRYNLALHYNAPSDAVDNTRELPKNHTSLIVEKRGLKQNPLHHFIRAAPLPLSANPPRPQGIFSVGI